MHPVAIEFGGEVGAVVHDERHVVILGDRLQDPRGAPNRVIVDLFEAQLQTGDIAASERLLRFEFPERPGALLRFLSAMGDRWNISLFHYRNQGAAFGRVLAGIQVPPEENEAFARFIEDIGYGAIEETDNPAYALFLQ